ncbi:MAG: cytochrome c oxidase subunit 3 [Schleiferiaceae bacterium]|nr:cytochrome c oxidase subunit 3 [Schleiferiaceae bacterium]
MGKLTQEEKKRVSKPMLWIAMASMAMAFAGLTSGYVVSRSSLRAVGGWMEFPLPSLFYISTVVIVLGSVFLIVANAAAKKDNNSRVVLGVGLALLSGIVFLILQIKGWGQLVDNGIFFAGSDSNSAGSWVYAISGVHILHLLGGVIALMVTFFKALKGRYTSTDKLGLELSSIYWHFLDVLWVYLFLFLLFIR